MSDENPRYRFIDELAADCSIDSLVDFIASKPPTSVTNSTLNWQHAHEQPFPETVNSTTPKFTSSQLEIGKFPADGDIRQISLLSQVLNSLLEKESKKKKSNNNNNNNNDDNNNKKKIFELLTQAHTGEYPLNTGALKPLFPMNSQCLNHGSYGNPPLLVSFCQSLYQRTIIDSDVDGFMRGEVYKRARDSRRALADYVGVADENELHLLSNLAETANVAIQSLIFNPLFLKKQLAAKNKRLNNNITSSGSSSSSSSSPKKFKIVYSTTTYPMVQECIASEMNRLLALASFSHPEIPENDIEALKKTLPFEYEIIPVEITREMVDSIGEAIPATNALRTGKCKQHTTDFDIAEEEGKMPLNPGMPGELPLEESCLFIDEFVNAVVDNDASVLILDHVAFSPAMIIPVDEIARRVKAKIPECLVIVDGAHSVGNIPLDFSNGTVTPCSSPGRKMCVDVFMSNLHKWLLSPKSLAFLWAKKELHCFLHPPCISNMYRGIEKDAWSSSPPLFASSSSSSVSATSAAGSSSSSSSSSAEGKQPEGLFGAKHIRPEDQRGSLDSRRATEHIWRGTLDQTGLLVVPDVLLWRYTISGTSGDNDERLIRSNRATALRGALLMSRIWKTDGDVLLANSPQHLPSLVCVRMPAACDQLNKMELFGIVGSCLEKTSQFLPIVFLPVAKSKPGQVQMFARVGSNVHSSVQDYEDAAKDFLQQLESFLASKK